MLNGDGKPEFKVSAIFSVEPIAERFTSAGLAFRRPDIKFELWNFPAAMQGAAASALVVVVHFRAAVNEGKVSSRDDDPGLNAASRWTGFYFGPDAQRASMTESGSAFPGGDWVSSPAPDALKGVAIYGDPTDTQDHYVGYTLYSSKVEASTWLRCPVMIVATEHEARGGAQACVWIWNDGRLQKLWLYDPLAAEKGDLPAPPLLAALGCQVLAFSRWHKGAILEHSEPAVWELIDSPLLNRSLELNVLTRTDDPTGKPRYQPRDRRFAAFTSDGASPVRLAAAPIRITRCVVKQGERPKRLAGIEPLPLVAPHLVAEVGLEFAGSDAGAEQVHPQPSQVCPVPD